MHQCSTTLIQTANATGNLAAILTGEDRKDEWYRKKTAELKTGSVFAVWVDPLVMCDYNLCT